MTHRHWPLPRHIGPRAERVPANAAGEPSELAKAASKSRSAAARGHLKRNTATTAMAQGLFTNLHLRQLD